MRERQIKKEENSDGYVQQQLNFWKLKAKNKSFIKKKKDKRKMEEIN